MGRRLIASALLLAAVGCGGGGKSEVGAAKPRRDDDTAPAVARGCPRVDWSGPWTACAEADWVRRVANAAAYRVLGETGSALIAEGHGDGFYIWTTRHEIVPPTAEIVANEGWTELGRAGGAVIYGDKDLWRWWSTPDALFWIQAGPYPQSTPPDVDELDDLVAASLRLPPPPR